MADSKTIVFFPEAAFGPSMNCVGIAQVLRERGHNPVFVADGGFEDVFKGLGFPVRPIAMSEPVDTGDASQWWRDFITSHIPHFRLSAYEQIPNYVLECWDTIVGTSVYAQPDLVEAFDEVKPDLICLDNCIMFPAVKNAGCPWVRITSCSENEIVDPDIPPHLSGCGENDKACFEAYRARFLEVIKPVHDRFNAFLESVGEAPYPPGQFLEMSPTMNLLLYPEQLHFNRRHPLDPKLFQYLEGCVRQDAPYTVPDFAEHADKPLLYISSGSMNEGDVDLLKRQIEVIGKLPYRALINVGNNLDAYPNVPGNIHLAPWFPQPSVIPQADIVIHHGGNNTFTESLYFGKPALIMPFCWDGHDNAQRIEDKGYGAQLPRYDWSEEEFAATLDRLMTDEAMHARLATISAHMQKQHGRAKAADILIDILERA